MTAPRLLAPPAGRKGPGPIAVTPRGGARPVVRATRRRGRCQGSTGPREWAPAPSSRQLRVYQPGDDVRRLDAAATRAHGEPHVRLRRSRAPGEHVDRARRVAVDGFRNRASAQGGRGRRRGAHCSPASPSAAADAWPRALRRRARAAARRPAAVAARRPSSSTPLARAWCPTEPGIDASLGRALARLGRLARSPGLVAVVSDFRSERGWARPLRVLAARHSLVAVDVSDPRRGESAERGRAAPCRSRVREADRGGYPRCSHAGALCGARARAPLGPSGRNCGRPERTLLS